MKAIFTRFVGTMVVVALMMNFGPTVIGAVGNVMFSQYSVLTESIMPSDGSAPSGDLANETLNKLDEAANGTLAGLNQVADSVFSFIRSAE